MGYFLGSRLGPHRELKTTLQELRTQCEAALNEGRRGVYTTLITDQQKSSELVIEVKELATTQAGQVKVEYLSAYYKNPDFRTKKGEALLAEVQELLGLYLPDADIEWYQQPSARQEKVQAFAQKLEKLSKTQERT